MNKLNRYSKIAGSLAMIGGATSTIYKIDWLLIISAMLMAISMFTTIFISEKAKKSSDI